MKAESTLLFFPKPYLSIAASEIEIKSTKFVLSKVSIVVNSAPVYNPLT